MPDISKRLEKAEKYVQKGRLDAAIEEYLAAWKEDPNNDALVEVIAELYARQGQPAKALECYGYLFDKHAERNDGLKAGLVFRKMVKFGVQDPARMLVFARLQEKQKPDEAQENYRQAAQLLLERGDKVKALEALRGLAGLEDQNARVHIQVAEVAESIGQKEAAAQSFARAGALLRAEHRNEEALKLLVRAHALIPGDAAVATALATAVFEAGDPKQAVELLEPFAAEAVPERNRLLAEAHLASGNLPRAEEILWGIAPRFPEAHEQLLRVAEGYLRRNDAEAAIRLLGRVKKPMFAARKDREFIAYLEGLEKKNLAGIPVLEFLSSLYNELNYDSLFSGTLARLFDLYVNAGEYQKAANALDHLVDVDPYDAQHGTRLQLLTGKLDDHRYQAIASRFQRPGRTGSEAAATAVAAEAATEESEAADGGGEGESNALEDLLLQAEIFLQYGLKPRAVERLKRIAKLFPGEENRNDKLRALYAAAQFTPKPVATPAAAAGSPGAAAAEAAEEGIADITRVSDITRNIYRQGTVKGVLSTSVNEIGKSWRVSRCVAGLCTPGKPPSAALEYCAPGTRQSDVVSIVKLVTTLVQTCADGNPLAVEDASSSAKLSKITPVIQSLEIRSLLALPLMDADQPIGVVVLEQCDRQRRWRSNEVVVLKTIVDQMVIATSHAKLRSLMKTLAVADERSGLLNRSSYLDCLLSECVRAQKQNTPLTVVLLQFGRGEQTTKDLGETSMQDFMQEAAQALLGHLRQNDIGVRYDNMTLALVLPDTRGKDTFFVVDKIRKVIGGIKVGDQESLPVAAGIAEAVVQGRIDAVDSVTELINRVEAALEAAQKEGGTSKLLMSPQESAAGT